MSDPTPRLVPELTYEQCIAFELTCALHRGFVYILPSPDPVIASLNRELAEVFYESAKRQRRKIEDGQ